MVRGLSLLAGIAVIAFTLIEGCSGEVAPFSNSTNSTNSSNSVGDDDVCTDPATCCKPEELVCVGNPDGSVVCSCRNLWNCDKNKNKCEHPVQTPDGQGGWNCTSWNEFTGLTCEKEGTKEEADEINGQGNFTCTYDSEMNKIVCKEDIISAPTSGAGDWNCKVTSTEGPQNLVCERNEKRTEKDVLEGSGEWDCNDDETECTRTDSPGLPNGGADWTCHEETIGGDKYITCTGTSEDNPMSGGGGWNCEKLPNEFNKWVCRRPKTGADTPGGDAHWACTMSSEFGGTKCTKVEETPEAPGPFPKPGEVCVPGTMRWCDGLQFCGWGMITCLPDGSWPTIVKNGKTMLDCKEREDGKVPATTCACYHFYFNPKCCERPDCIIPADTDGQNCPKSDGDICDYCNPRNPECKNNGMCAVSNSMETFCTVPCGANKSCPSNMICMPVKSNGQVSNQCIPSDFSCYNGL